MRKVVYSRAHIQKIYLLRLLRVPHGRFEGAALTLVALLASQDEADMALVHEGVPAVIKHHEAVHAGPAMRAPLWCSKLD